MRRDWKVIREVLLDVERIDRPLGLSSAELYHGGPELEVKTLRYHLDLLADNGFVKFSGNGERRYLGLTWSGHDLLEKTGRS